MISLKLKLIAAIAGATLAAAAITGVWWHGHSHGKRTAEHTANQAVIAHQAGMRELSDRLAIAEQRRAEIVYRDREVIRHVIDPTGCADTAIPDGIIERLY
jgi:hypothetical protein